MKKLSIIRTDKSNVKHLSAKTMDQFMQRIKTDDNRGTVAALRKEMPLIAAYNSHFASMYLLPRIYPVAELGRDAAGNIVFEGMTGLVLLSVKVNDANDIDTVKKDVGIMPSTVAAFAGSSNLSVKILVAARLKNNKLPKSEDEAECFYATAYKFVCKLYGGILPDIRKQKPSLRSSFRMTVDGAPYYNPKAIPLCIDMDAESEKHDKQHLPGGVSVSQQRKIDFEHHADMEFLYGKAVEKVTEKMSAAEMTADDNRLAYICELAHQLCRMGMSEEDAVYHILGHGWTYAEDDVVRQTVKNAYMETKPQKKTDAAMGVRMSAMNIMRFMESRYVFRYNTVMGYTEFRPNDSSLIDFQPVDSRVINRIAYEARTMGIDVWSNDVDHYVNSAYIDKYSPIEAYLDTCRGKWDGKDRIGELAKTVPADCGKWKSWFHIWFLGMVKQWMRPNHNYGNSVAPLLISRQGYNKSTFCRRLLPTELQWGYTDCMQIQEKKQVLLSMTQFLLVNLDEFNMISPDVQQGFLKNIIQLPTVKVKRPYAKHVEDIPRIASFIATSNMTDVLSDPSGSRRFIAVELKKPIDTEYIIDYEQLYAQAVYEVEQGRPTYFDAAETVLIMQNNEHFRQKSPAEMYFHDYFTPAEKETEGEYLTTTAIFDRIKSHVGSGLKLKNAITLGRYLSNLANLKQKRTINGTEYLVKALKN